MFARDFGCLQRSPPTKSLSWRSMLGSLGVVVASQELGRGRGPFNLMCVSPELGKVNLEKVSLGKLEGASGVDSHGDEMIRSENGRMKPRVTRHCRHH